MTTENDTWLRNGDRLQIRSPKMIARRSREPDPVEQADQIQTTTMLVEDRIAAQQLIASTGAINQVAPFHNPMKGGAIEAVVISNALGKDDQLLYLCSSPASPTGWSLQPILDGSGNEQFAREVITYQTTWGGVDGIYVGTGGTLRWMRLETGGWTAFQDIHGAPSNMSRLGVAYSPGARADTGVVCIYGAHDKDLFLLYRKSGTGDWGQSTIANVLQPSLTSLKLTMMEETTWQIGYTTDLYAAETIAAGTMTFDPPSAALLWGPSNPAGLTARRALGSLAGQLYQGAPAGILLCLDQNGVFSWTCGPANFQLSHLANAVFTDAVVLDITGYAYTHAFGIDADRNLWTFFQDGQEFSPSADPWSASEILDRGIVKLCPPALAAVSSTFMALDGDGGLHLYFQDPSTGFWAAGPVVYSTGDEFVLPRWRTEVVLYKNGAPLPYAELTVSAESALALSVGAECFFIDSNTDAVLETDILGKATFTTVASGTATPSLTFSSPGLPVQAAYSPSAPVTSYFSGTGALPGWGDGVRDAFSPDVLKNARAGGQPLVPAIQGASPAISPDEAAKMISNTAALGSPAALAALRARGLAGFMATKTDDGRMRYQEFTSSAELQAARARRRAELGIAPAPEGIFDTFKDWVGNTWHGITKTVSKVTDFVVDLGTKTIDAFVDVGHAVKKAFTWVADTVERAAEGVVAAFNWLESKIEDVVDWIKGLFDFKAIWNTKKAFTQLMQQFPDWMSQQLQAGGNYLQDGFFASMNEKIKLAFDDAKVRYAGQSFAQQPDWQPMGSPPEAGAPIVGDASANDYSNNPKANWFTNQVASYEPDQLPAPPDSAWTNFGDALSAAGSDFKAALDDMATILKTLMNPSEPSSFQNIVIPAFLDMIENVITTLVNLVDAVIQAFLAFGQTLAGELGTFFRTPVSLGFVETVYKWIAKLGGDEDPGPPTVCDFFALLTAFPCTIVYKLINGADTQPFPDGQLPSAARPGAADLDSEQICLMCASIVKTLGLVPALIADMDSLKPVGSGKSSWASGVGIAITVISSVLAFEPTYIGFGPIEWGVTAVALVAAAQFAVILWSVGAISSVMAWKNANPDITAMGSSAFSILMMAGSLVSDAYKGAKPLAYITHIMKSLSGAAGFLMMKPVQVLLGGPEIAVPLKVGIDVAGYVSGGILGTYLATDPDVEDAAAVA